jgi:hypothetical protein
MIFYERTPITSAWLAPDGARVTRDGKVYFALLSQGGEALFLFTPTL